MRQIILTTIVCLSFSCLKAQNTFPSTGPIGMGTGNPQHFVSIVQPNNGIGLRMTSGQSFYAGYYFDISNNDFTPWGKQYRITTNARLDISSGESLFLFANDIHLAGNVIVTRITGLPDPTSPAGSYSSRSMPFEANVYDASINAGRLLYAGLKNVASTTTSLGHRLAFKLGSHNTDLSDGIENLSVLSNGNVGIGVIDPQVKLAVSGEIKATKLTVKALPWADYVFENSYKLPSLEEIEQFIKIHKHLPEIPSALEVEKNGIDVGQNQALLLKKIEELTLYLIIQSKKQESMSQQLKEQRKEIKKLKKTLQDK